MAKDLKSYNNQSMKGKFSGYSAAPSEELWGKVADALDEKNDRKPVPIWWAMGISACIGIFLLFNYSDKNTIESGNDLATFDDQQTPKNETLLSDQKEVLVKNDDSENGSNLKEALAEEDSKANSKDALLSEWSNLNIYPNESKIVNQNSGIEPHLIVRKDIEKIHLSTNTIEIDTDTNLVENIDSNSFDWDDFENSQTSWELSVRMDQLALATQSINVGDNQFESIRQKDPGVIAPSIPTYTDPIPVMRISPPQRFMVTAGLNVKRFSVGLSVGIEKWRMSKYSVNQNILLEKATIYSFNLPLEVAYTWLDKSRFKIRSGVHFSSSFYLGKSVKVEEIKTSFLAMEMSRMEEKGKAFSDYRISGGVNSTAQYFLNERWFLRVDSYAGIALRNYKSDSHLVNAKKYYFGFGGGIGLSF